MQEGLVFLVRAQVLVLLPILTAVQLYTLETTLKMDKFSDTSFQQVPLTSFITTEQLPVINREP